MIKSSSICHTLVIEESLLKRTSGACAYRRNQIGTKFSMARQNAAKPGFSSAARTYDLLLLDNGMAHSEGISSLSDPWGDVLGG